MMSFLDIMIVVIVIYQLFIGLKKGLIKIVCDVVALFCGVMGGYYYYADFAYFLQAWTSFSGDLLLGVSFVLIFLAVFVAFSLISGVLNKIISFASLGLVNRVAGGMLGMVKGAVIILPFLVILTYYDVSILNRSLIVGPFKPFLTYITQQVVTQLALFMS